MNCPVCNTSIDGDVNKCPHCNSDLEVFVHVNNVDKKINKQKTIILIISIVLAICIVGLIVSFMSSGSNKEELNQLKQDNKSLTEEVTLLKTNISDLNQQVTDLKKKRSELLAQETSKEAMNPKQGSTYLVKQGDTLWDIAMEVYGDPFHWEKIAEANNVSEPKQLHIGTKLILN